jgi:hypothetical protein
VDDADGYFEENNVWGSPFVTRYYPCEGDNALLRPTIICPPVLRD